jgi:DNA-directed RNA polymerase specialized sigma24 family protein
MTVNDLVSDVLVGDALVGDVLVSDVAVAEAPAAPRVPAMARPGGSSPVGGGRGSAAAGVVPLPEVLGAFAPLLAAEAAAEAGPGGLAGVEAGDLEQAVWLRWLEGPGPPPGEAAEWLRAAVRAEVRDARRRALREVAYDPVGGPGAASAETQVLDAEVTWRVREAVRRLPGRCPRLVSALLSRSDRTYREISRELGISQGSLGPLRSRCLGCLRTALGSEG